MSFKKTMKTTGTVLGLGFLAIGALAMKGIEREAEERQYERDLEEELKRVRENRSGNLFVRRPRSIY